MTITPDALRQRIRIKDKRARGECDSCKLPALLGRHFCQHHYDERRERSRRDKLKNPAHEMFMSTRTRARRKGITFTITESDIIVPKRCPILGIVVILGASREQVQNAPSLDKIDPNKGYIPGNVQVISCKANAMKNNGSLDELIKLGNWARRKKKELSQPVTIVTQL